MSVTARPRTRLTGVATAVAVAMAAAVAPWPAGAAEGPAQDVAAQGVAAPQAAAACGDGDAVVTGSQEDGFTATYHGEVVYEGEYYVTAIWEAIGSLTPGRTSQEKVSVMASGWIGDDNSIELPSHTAFETCGTMAVGHHAGRGAVEAVGATDVSIPYLNMTGAPYFGMRFADVHGLHLGQIDLRLDGGLGIRFERDLPESTTVSMDDVYVSGTDNHGVETWNVNGLDIGTVVARDVGYAGLLLNNTRHARIGLVDGENVGTGTGYATFRTANTAGRQADGSYGTNIEVDKVVSRGGGRGIFCVSQSGGLHVGEVDLADNGNNAVLIENCYNVTLASGTVDGGGEVRVSARSEFANTRDVSVSLTVNGTSVRESPCGENITWDIDGDASVNVC